MCRISREKTRPRKPHASAHRLGAQLRSPSRRAFVLRTAALGAMFWVSEPAWPPRLPRRTASCSSPGSRIATVSSRRRQGTRDALESLLKGGRRPSNASRPKSSIGASASSRCSSWTDYTPFRRPIASGPPLRPGLQRKECLCRNWSRSRSTGIGRPRRPGATSRRWHAAERLAWL